MIVNNFKFPVCVYNYHLLTLHHIARNVNKFYAQLSKALLNLAGVTGTVFRKPQALSKSRLKEEVCVGAI